MADQSRSQPPVREHRVQNWHTRQSEQLTKDSGLSYLRLNPLPASGSIDLSRRDLQKRRMKLLVAAVAVLIATSCGEAERDPAETSSPTPEVIDTLRARAAAGDA